MSSAPSAHGTHNPHLSTILIPTKYPDTDLSADTCTPSCRNFPLILSLGKVVPALLTGNCIIVKPSPFTPYSTLKAIEIAQEVYEPGIVQAIGGDDKLGPMFTAHQGIAKISFTGSIATGKKIMAACAPTLKRVTLELGGNDASIILPDVDIKKVAPEVVMGAFQNSGQVCVATKRIYIHESIYKDFLAEMVNFVKTIKVGEPDSGSLLGPVQNQMQFERVKGFFEDTKSKGYKVAVGADTVEKSNGFFVTPTIIDNPPNDSRIIAEEPFGPIVPTQPWTDEEEVIRRANNTNTGLGACVWGTSAPFRLPHFLFPLPTSQRASLTSSPQARTYPVPKPSPNALKPAPFSSTPGRNPHPKPSSADTKRAASVASGAPRVCWRTATRMLFTLISRSKFLARDGERAAEQHDGPGMNFTIHRRSNAHPEGERSTWSRPAQCARIFMLLPPVQ